MSLVGTRPPTVDEWDKYELHHRARLATKPGLTGMWQVSGRSNITDLYSNAMSFVFPSLYEGFGIPILESFSYGIPVITARNSSLPEVGGDAAIYMENVHSSEQLEEAMQTIINMDVQEREKKIIRGTVLSKVWYKI